jgi:hypothetical protein
MPKRAAFPPLPPSSCVLVSLAAALLFLPRDASAQQDSSAALEGQIERSRLPNPTLPVSGGLGLGTPVDAAGEVESNAPATSGDNDLGVQAILNAPVKPEPWSIFADGGFLFTSNVALTHRHTESDVFFVGEGGVGYDWKVSPELTVSASGREQYFAYNKYTDLDFGSIDFALAISYVAHELDDIVLSAQLGFTRLTHRSIVDNEFYRNGGLSLGAEKTWALGRAQAISTGGDIELGVSVPHVAEREEFGLSTAYTVQCTRMISLQAGVRTAYYLYADSGRQDFNLTGSTGLTLAVTPWCSLGATFSGTLDRSNHEVFAYDVINTGVTVFFRLRF